MNILHISPYFPSLKDKHAGGVCMGKEIETLKLNNNVYVLTFFQKKYDEHLLNDIVQNENTYYVKLNSVKKLVNIILHPLTANYFATRTSLLFTLKLIQIIKTYKINAIHAEYTAMGQYVLIKKIFPNIIFNVVLHDVTIQNYERQLTGIQSSIKKMYHKFQTKLIYKNEKRYLSRCDNVITFSDKDKDLVNKYYDISKNVYVMNTYFNLEHELKVGDYRKSTYKGEMNICFMGQMGRKENYLAAINLIDIFNTIKNSVPEAKLFIIGNNPPEILKELGNESIIITGFVDDIDQYMINCRVAAYPLEFGAGIKIKVLHSMALGIPVITTDVGAEGIDEDGKVLLIANNKEEFRKNLITLLSDDLVYQDKSKAVQGFARENFNWEASKNLLDELY